MYCYLDFEYFGTTKEILNVVCCSLWTLGGDLEEYWVLNDELEQGCLAARLEELRDAGYTFFAWNAVAECSAMYSLGLNPLDFKFIDGFLEYRCLTNHNDSLQWGEQLVDGKVKKVKKPKEKWERTEEDNGTGFKAKHSLSEATFKLLNLIIDTDEKNKMRDIIISSNVEEIEANRQSIMSYCSSDITNLSNLHAAIIREYNKKLKPKYRKTLEQEMLERGNYAAHTAIMERVGYPIDVRAAKNFSSQVRSMISACQRDINEQFPDIVPFTWDKKANLYKWSQIKTKEWVKANCDVGGWLKTENKDISLSLEAFQRFFDYRHEYPRNNFGAQMVRYLKLKQSLNGFVPPANGSDKKTFWSYVGDDGRVRPYMNIYGSQSSRSQPAATGFLFLKPAWMRSLCRPPKGKIIVGIDYKSEEFLISGLLANDKNMLDAYESGDVYLYFAKLAGAVPKDGTKSQYKAERDLFKATVLGLSYLMSKYGLANKLTLDTGRKYTEDEAQEFIDLFYEKFSALEDFQEKTMLDYQIEGLTRLADGWYVFGDNENFRSVCNVPSQGTGAVVMRRAVDIAVRKYNLKVIITLHDALYIECDEDDFSAIDKLDAAMKEAFVNTIPHPRAKLIGTDIGAWGDVFEEDAEFTTPAGKKFHASKIYIDDRAIDEYKKFNKYFDDVEEFL